MTLTAILTAAAAAVTTGGLLRQGNLTPYAQIQRLVLVPDKLVNTSPKQIGVPYDRNVIFTMGNSSVNVLGSWWIPSRETQRKVILYCHPARGNMGWYVDLARFVYHHLPECSLMMFDYTGFGDSDSDINPSIDTCHVSTKQAYDWLLCNKNVEARNVIVWGEGLGGMFAARLCESEPPVGGLVLHEPTGAREAASKVANWWLWAFTGSFDDMDRVVESCRAAKTATLVLSTSLPSNTRLFENTNDWLTLAGNRNHLLVNDERIVQRFKTLFCDNVAV